MWCEEKNEAGETRIEYVNKKGLQRLGKKKRKRTKVENGGNGEMKKKKDLTVAVLTLCISASIGL